jgi:DNA replication and repair protein RecF
LRNHQDSSFEFADSTNIFYGLNGVGKTTILEAISISGLTKSFLPVQDQSLINQGSSEYYIDCHADTDLKTGYNIKIKYEKGAKKQIDGTEGNNLLPKDVIGLMPVVVLSPDFKSITFGSPQDRRSFIDKTLSQSNKRYIEEILKHKKCLKQRNNILNEGKKNDVKFDEALFDAWTVPFIDSSAEIIHKRNNFINEFKPYFKDIYSGISNNIEDVDLFYNADHFKMDDDLNDIVKIREYLSNLAEELKLREIKRGTTLFGPQKDDIDIMINNGNAKEIASQGQHKSLLISLKFAEFNYLKENKKETPIILLDDIFAELDSNRSELVMQMLQENMAQTFITLTNKEIIRSEFINQIETKYFQIENGKLIE